MTRSIDKTTDVSFQKSLRRARRSSVDGTTVPDDDDVAVFDDAGPDEVDEEPVGSFSLCVGEICDVPLIFVTGTAGCPFLLTRTLSSF